MQAMDNVSNRDLSQVTILFVDDEQNILNSLRRAFQPEGYEIRIASSGAAGLTVLEHEPIDLVVSDMRMPGMSGAEFLARVAERWPSTTRILLTGFADLKSTIEAINHGKIFGYISKPWQEDELKLSIRNALELRRLQQERDRLLELTRQQNNELLELNATLEERVRHRTAELAETAGMFELAYSEMKQAYLQAVPVFAQLVEFQEGELRGHAHRIAERARGMAQRLGLPEEEVEQVFHAGLLHAVGKIGLPDRILRAPYFALSISERSLYETYPSRGAAALTSLEPLAPVADIIRHHREHLDGSGFPNRLATEKIPRGARILLVAVEYDELLLGSLLPNVQGPAAAIAFLSKNAGTRYDPAAVNALLTGLRSPQRPAELQVDETIPSLRLRVGELRPGMRLARDLINSHGVLMIPRGYRLSSTLIARLSILESEAEQPFSLYVVDENTPQTNKIR